MKLARQNAESELLDAVRGAELEYHKAQEMASNYGIAGNTFRAFRNCEVSPSHIYRTWVNAHGYNLVNAQNIETRNEFLEFHGVLERSLSEFWEVSGCRPLKLAERNKIIDLFTKAVAFSISHPCEQQRPALYKYANIPLDKFSLLAVKRLFYGIVICDNPSMGNIRDEETYNFIQSQIFQLTAAVNVANLVFDHYSWNMKH